MPFDRKCYCITALHYQVGISQGWEIDRCNFEILSTLMIIFMQSPECPLPTFLFHDFVFLTKVGGGDEDCLYLAVHVPVLEGEPCALFSKLRSQSSDQKWLNLQFPDSTHEPLPVMVWLTGGAFLVGGGSWWVLLVFSLLLNFFLFLLIIFAISQKGIIQIIAGNFSMKYHKQISKTSFAQVWPTVLDDSWNHPGTVQFRSCSFSSVLIFVVVIFVVVTTWL